MDLKGDILLDLYECMVRIRRFEEKCVELTSQGQFASNPHLGIGQEATIAGVCRALREDDYITGTHRSHGHNLARGARSDKLMAELLGRSSGYCGGRGGTLHVAALDRGVIGCYPVVGDTLGVATGIGLSIKLRGSGRVVASFFGDGAAGAGTFNEAINLAAVWKLPVIFVCENNLYAISTPISKATLVTDIALKSAAFGIPGVTVDGMDAVKVYEEANKAIEKARREEGPTLLECKTYRFRGSSEGEPGNPWKLKYRSREELEQWMRRDPVSLLADKLKNGKIADDKKLEDIAGKIESEMEEAVAFALSSPYPKPEAAVIPI